MDDAQLANWLATRAGKLTGSRMAEAMSFRKDGKPSAERTNLMKELLAERLTGITMRHYVTPAMEWGTKTEPEAKAYYEAVTGEIIRPCGFYDHPRIDMVGATPDGLLAHDGVLECKCPTTGTHIEWLRTGAVPDEYKPQMILEITCSGRKWAEFVSYDPRIKDERLRMIVRRFEPTAEEIARVETAAEQFLADLDAAWEQLTTA